MTAGIGLIVVPALAIRIRLVTFAYAAVMAEDVIESNTEKDFLPLIPWE
jgi:hypothetical protein